MSRRIDHPRIFSTPRVRSSNHGAIRSLIVRVNMAWISTSQGSSADVFTVANGSIDRTAKSAWHIPMRSVMSATRWIRHGGRRTQRVQAGNQPKCHPMQRVVVADPARLSAARTNPAIHPS
jgi:hypothetical protein